VVGAITSDVIICADSSRHAGLGGVLYNAAALMALGVDRVSLVANVGADIAGQLAEFQRQHPGADLANVRTAQPTNVRCHLWELGHATLEVHEHFPPPLLLAQVLPVLGAQAVLVTFPIGCEMSLSTLRALRSRHDGPLYLDFHTLSMGTDLVGVRYLRRVRRWLDWVRLSDIVQLNLAEACVLTGSELATPSERTSLAAAVLDAGPRILLLTMGLAGCLCFEAGDGGIRAQQFSAVEPLGPVVTTVGCGDVFAGAFLATYLRSGDSQVACRIAAAAASSRCGVAGLRQLPDALAHLNPGRTSAAGKLSGASRSRPS